MTSGTIRLGIGMGGLALEQWRSLEERVADLVIDIDVLGLPHRADHSELLLDRLARGSHEGVIIPTRYLPVELPEPLEILAVARRRTPLSALICEDGIILDEFERGAVIGVEGPFPAAQLQSYRSDIRYAVLPGGVRDHLRMLESLQVHALVAPAAFAEWFGIQDRVSEILSVDVVVPMAGQGSLCLVAPSVDADRLAALVKALNDPLAYREVTAERDVVRLLCEDGPVLAGALMRQQGDVVEIDAAMVDPGGRRRVRDSVSGPRDTWPDLARTLAAQILARQMLTRD